jgi:uncharacterized protein (TIGR00251 family)
MLLRIKVKPNSKTDEIIREKIKAQPIDGKANKYLVGFLSKVLSLPRSGIMVIKGESNSFKTLEIEASEDYVLAAINKVAM